MEQIPITSLLIGFVIIISLVVFLHFPTIIREIGLWISWYHDIKQVRSLPSPPGHWIWGHTAEVRYIIYVGSVKSDMHVCRGVIR